MAGLNLGLGGGIGTIGGGMGQRSPASTVTVAQTAYGAGSSPTNTSGLQLWHVGAIGVPLFCVAGLIFLRWSLPR